VNHREPHERHDLELVARAAAGDLASGEAIADRDLLAWCHSCASLTADLRAIASATRQLPTAAARSAVLPAPRDFRLTAADAAHLRPGGLNGLVRRLGGGRGFGSPARGLGGALATLGLVGLLVSVAIPGLGGTGGAIAGADGQHEDGASKTSASAVAAMFPTASDAYALSATGEPSREIGGATDTAVGSPVSQALVVGASIGVLVTGIGLIIIGWCPAGRAP
jgi:hypothetical protein